MARPQAQHARILGTGSCLPGRVLTNQELEARVDTTDEWITTRTGISTRRIAGRGETTYQLAAEAGRRALADARVDAAELDLIVVATMSPHMIMPSCACFAQAELGAGKAHAFDLNAACSGFLYGLDMAEHYIRGSREMKILLIGAETLSARTDWEDRNTCILFGDGAGACVIGARREPAPFTASSLHADGSLWSLLYMHGPRPNNPDLVPEGFDGGGSIRMNGREVFKHAVRAMEEACRDLFASCGADLEDIALFVPHQANIRILDKLRQRLGIPEERVYINVNRYGNTSAASVPIALDEAARQGRLSPGDLVLICAFGGGFTWGAMLWHW